VRLGILGGTFDPIHNGHMAIARRAQIDLGLERVFLVPAGDPWRKRLEVIASGAHRLSMIKLAIESEDGLEVSAVELDRAGPSYTEATLSQLSAEHGKNVELYFIIGEDSLCELHLWKSPSRILTLARLIIAPRLEGSEVDLGLLNRIKPGASKRALVLDIPKVSVSSTEVRTKVANGTSVNDLVPSKVEEYILANGLYSNREK